MPAIVGLNIVDLLENVFHLCIHEQIHNNIIVANAICRVDNHLARQLCSYLFPLQSLLPSFYCRIKNFRVVFCE